MALDHLGEIALEFRALGRGVGGGENPRADLVDHGRDERGLPPGVRQQGADKRCNRRLAVGARDAHGLDEFGGATVEAATQFGERHPHIRHEHQGDIRRHHHLPRGKDRHRAPADSVGNITRAVATRPRNHREQIPRTDLPRVERQAAYATLGELHQHRPFERLDQLA